MVQLASSRHFASDINKIWIKDIQQENTQPLIWIPRWLSHGVDSISNQPKKTIYMIKNKLITLTTLTCDKINELSCMTELQCGEGGNRKSHM